MNVQDMGVCGKGVVYLTSTAYGKYTAVYLAYPASRGVTDKATYGLRQGQSSLIWHLPQPTIKKAFR